MTTQPADDEDFVCRICTKKKQKAAQYQAYKARLQQKKHEMDQATNYATKRSKDAYGDGATMHIKEEPYDPSDIIEEEAFSPSMMDMKEEVCETVVPMETDEIVSVVSTPAENSPVGFSMEGDGASMEVSVTTTEEVASGKSGQLERIPEESDSIPSSIEKMLATVEKELDGASNNENFEQILSNSESNTSTATAVGQDKKSSTAIEQVEEGEVSPPEVRASTPEERASTPEMRMSDSMVHASMLETKRPSTPEIRVPTLDARSSEVEMKAAVQVSLTPKNLSGIPAQITATPQKENVTSDDSPTTSPPVLTPRKVASPELLVASISTPLDANVATPSSVGNDSQITSPPSVQQPVIPTPAFQTPPSPPQRDSSGSNSPSLEMPDIRETRNEISPVEMTSSLAPPSITKLSPRPSPPVVESTPAPVPPPQEVKETDSVEEMVRPSISAVPSQQNGNNGSGAITDYTLS